MKAQEDCFTLDFDFILHLKSEAFSKDDAFFDLPFRDLSLHMNKGAITELGFRKFMDELGENLCSLANQLFEKVVKGEVFEGAATQENMEKLVKFLTIKGIQWGIDMLMAFLVCKLGSKAAAYGLIGAITGLVDGGWKWGTIFVAVESVIGSMDDDGIFKVEKRVPKQNPDTKKNPDTPASPTLFFENDRLKISWPACKNASGYRPLAVRVLEGGKEESLVLPSCQVTSCEIAGTLEDRLYKVSYGYVYKVKVYVWNDEGCAVGGEERLYLLSQPVLSKVLYRCEDRSLRVAWNILKGAGAYEAVVEWREGTQDKRLSLTCTPVEREAVFQNFAPERLVNIYVRGKAERVIGPASVFKALYLYDRAAPRVTESYAAEKGIALAWDKAPYAEAYSVSCLNDAEKEVYRANTIEDHICIPETYLQDDTTYLLNVRAYTGEIEGIPSEKTSVLWYQLPVPEIKGLICGEDGTLLFNLSVKGRDCSQLVTKDGGIVNLTDTSFLYGWEIQETARVRLAENKRNGKWSSEISVEPIKTPRGLRLNIKEDRLQVSWEETGEKLLYMVELRTGGCFLSSGSSHRRTAQDLLFHPVHLPANKHPFRLRLASIAILH